MLCLEEKWLGIQGFMNFTTANFVIVRHTMNLHNILPLSLVHEINVLAISHYPRFMIIGEDRTNRQYKTDSFVLFESYYFVTTK